MRPMRILWMLLLAAVLPAQLAHAQRVRLEGGEGIPAATVIREIIARDDYLLLDRDTTLDASFRAPGDLLVVDADVRLEGEVPGDVGVLNGALFLRPSSRVTGRVAALGGGAYPSGLATLGELIEADIGVGVSVQPEPSGFRVRISPAPSVPRLTLPGLFGFRLPTYDRVDGLTVAWGPRWRITGEEFGPTVEAFVSYRTARGDFGGGLEAGAPLGGGVRLEAEVARATFTNEEWIRGDLANSAGALLVGSDVRNYHESDYAALTLSRPIDPTAYGAGWAFGPRLTLLASEDRSLSRNTEWSLFGELDRINPLIDPGTIVSATAATEVRWTGRSSEFSGEVSLERGLEGPGDFDFTQWVADGFWEVDALWDHTLSLYGRGMGTLGSESAPRQRWSFIGGSGTLPTFDIAELRGDHLLFVRSVYEIPLGFVRVPFLGSPALRLAHSTGTAWESGEDVPSWLQNLGVGLAFSLVHADLVVDPEADGFDPHLSLGASLPF